MIIFSVLFLGVLTTEIQTPGSGCFDTENTRLVRAFSTGVVPVVRTGGADGEAVVHREHTRFVFDSEPDRLLVVMLLQHDAERRHEVVIRAINKHTCPVHTHTHTHIYIYTHIIVAYT